MLRGDGREEAGREERPGADRLRCTALEPPGSCGMREVALALAADNGPLTEGWLAGSG